MLKFPKLLSDGCVLQQGEGCKIWGFGTPGEQVRISVCQNRDGRRDTLYACRAQTDATGRFAACIQTPQPGGPYLLLAQSENGEELLVQDVYVGDVFVCAGQSNMELPMSRVRMRFPEEFRNGGAPDVRLYKVTEQYDFDFPQEDHAAAGWTACTSEHLREISALSYFIGKQLAALRGIPIGILNLSLGGTPAEAWMSREGLKGWPELLQILEKHQDSAYCKELLQKQARKERAWTQELHRQEKGSADAPFYAAKLPGTLADWGLKEFCGCLYLRRTFCVPPDAANRGGLLRFGTLIDSDTIFINGKKVGDTPYRYPPRRYPVPEGLLKAGENEIIIRLVCREGDGRVTDGKPLDIIWEDVCSDDFSDKNETGQTLPEPISLAGDWEYQVRAVCGRAPEQIFLNRVPTGLFNGMAAPCLPFAVKGVVWYQGESNDQSPGAYEKLLQDLICDWREKWGRELPFVVVQLPNCDVDIAPGDAWPQIREAQQRAEALKDVAVTVNLDAGEDNDLHPLDKKTVAERAVQALLAVAYREAVEYRGPRLAGAQAGNGWVRLRFSSADGKLLLKSRSENPGKENPRLFELAGEDGVYYPATAEFAHPGGAHGQDADGCGLILRAPQVTKPCYVRYAWDRAPGALLLYDGSGRCAAPFCKSLADEAVRTEKDGKINEK